ncbi:MAG TPA: hypothetical protein VG297_02810 [Bryobacteraceae bacterium]|jgi:hypothetical protein|nr:hypothetical protein [Bryobacteraceae bacterium]
MSLDVEPIPESFLSRLLNEFGLQWTHIVVLSGVVFSSFELEQYLNPGIWILGTVAALSVVYLFRHQITGNFGRTAVWALIAAFVVLAAPCGALIATHKDVLNLLETWKKTSSLYLALALGIPLGVMILSYRAQADFRWEPLPQALATAVKQVAQCDFIHEAVQYSLHLRHDAQGGVILRFEVVMDVLNRSKRPALYQDYFDPAGRNKRFLSAEIKGKQIPEDDPDRIYQRGLALSHNAAPGERFRVAVTGESTFHESDSELVGVYFPCCRLSLKVARPPDDLRVHVVSLLPEKVDPEPHRTGDLMFEYAKGVLPFQGTRIFWAPRGAALSYGVMA